MSNFRFTHTVAQSKAGKQIVPGFTSKALDTLFGDTYAAKGIEGVSKAAWLLVQTVLGAIYTMAQATKLDLGKLTVDEYRLLVGKAQASIRKAHKYSADSRIIGPATKAAHSLVLLRVKPEYAKGAASIAVLADLLPIAEAVSELVSWFKKAKTGDLPGSPLDIVTNGHKNWAIDVVEEGGQSAYTEDGLLTDAVMKLATAKARNEDERKPAFDGKVFSNVLRLERVLTTEILAGKPVKDAVSSFGSGVATIIGHPLTLNRTADENGKGSHLRFIYDAPTATAPTETETETAATATAATANA